MTFPFLSLPIELRLAVYKQIAEVSARNIMIEVEHRCRKCSPKHETIRGFTLATRTAVIPILLACRSIYEESLPVFLKSDAHCVPQIILPADCRHWSHANSKWRDTTDDSWRLPWVKLLIAIDKNRMQDMPKTGSQLNWDPEPNSDGPLLGHLESDDLRAVQRFIDHCRLIMPLEESDDKGSLRDSTLIRERATPRESPIIGFILQPGTDCRGAKGLENFQWQMAKCYRFINTFIGMIGFQRFKMRLRIHLPWSIFGDVSLREDIKSAFERGMKQGLEQWLRIPWVNETVLCEWEPSIFGAKV